MTWDLIIVGAGLAGCSTAWHLAPHRRVLLLEQREQAGLEASAQNAGMVRTLATDPVEQALAIRSYRSIKNPPGDDWRQAPPFTQVGAILAGAEPMPNLQKAAAKIAEAGLRIEKRRATELIEFAPAMAGSPVSDVWWMPEAGLADAHSLLQGFLRGARRQGAELRTGVKIQGLQIDKGRAVGVQTEQGIIYGGAVLLAAGAWSRSLAAGVGLERPLQPLARHLLHTHPVPNINSAGHPYCWIDDVGIYIRPEAGGWLISPCDEQAVEPPLGGHSAGGVTDFGKAMTGDLLGRYFPQLAKARFAGGWTGLRTFAPDRRPFLGPDPELTNLWWAAGLGGFGVTCSFAIGEVVSALMLGNNVDWLDTAAVDPGRTYL